MALQIITGDHAINKKAVMINHLHQIFTHNPSAEIYYIIPDHIKFDMETTMLDQLKQIQGGNQAAMLNIQVASFSRISWFMMPHYHNEAPSISSIGKKMILRSILSELKSQLVTYRSQITYQGFIDKLYNQFEEFIQGNIDQVTLEQLIEAIDEEEIGTLNQYRSSQRLNEINTIYTTYIDKLNQLNINYRNDYFELIDYLENLLPQENLYIAIDHYEYFTGEQLYIINQLIRVAHTVWIQLPIDSDHLLNTSHYSFEQVAKNTYFQLKRLCNVNGLKQLNDWQINGPTYPYHSDILAVAKTYQALNEFKPVEKLSLVQSEHIELWHNDTIQTEMKHVVNQIHYLVSQKKYRYRDIRVLTRSFDCYGSLIEPYFKMNDIPCFIDNTQEMQHHPFVLLLEGLLNLSIQQWNYTSIMAVLNSSFILPSFLQNDQLSPEELRIEKQHQVNQLENILIENGLFGYRLYQIDYPWHYSNESLPYYNAKGEKTEQTIEEMVQPWRNWLHQLSQILKRPAELTGESFAKWVYQVMDHLKLKEQLIFERDYLIQQGRIEQSMEEEQVWNTMIDLLDEFCLIYQNQTESYETFVQILLAGMNEASFLIIPPTMDQVMISSMISPRTQPTKVTFVIGMNHQTLPQSIQEDSLMTRQERELLLSMDLMPHQSIQHTPAVQYQAESFLFYKLLLASTERLYLSYAQVVEDQTVERSPYIQELLNWVELPTYHFKVDPTEELTQPHPSSYGRYSIERSKVMYLNRFYWQQSVNYLPPLRKLIASMKEYELQHSIPDAGRIDNLVKRSVEDFIQPVSINPETARQLYGDQLSLSVSKIEEYYRDAYSHFLLYGLKLKERIEFELDPARTGDFFHEYLDQVTQQATNHYQRSLLTLDDAALLDIIHLIENQLSHHFKFQILHSSARMKFIHQLMNQEMRQVLNNLIKKVQITQLEPVLTEAIFGLNPILPLRGLYYQLDSQRTLQVTGKIDRIDRLQLGEDTYYQVVDYKSSQKEFNLVELFYGLDMQILTYLKVIHQNYPNAFPLGAFYQPITHINELATHDVKDEKEQSLADYTYRGFITLPEVKMQQIDSTLEPQTASLIYPVKLKKDGSYDAYSNRFNETDFQLLSNYVDYLFVEAANQIQSGNIALTPYRDERFTTSLQPGFRTITGFDATEHYHLYRHKQLRKKDIIQKIEQILQSQQEEVSE